jgi:hypothetical protein
VLFAAPGSATTRLGTLLPAHVLCGAVGLIALADGGANVLPVATAAGLAVWLMRPSFRSTIRRR